MRYLLITVVLALAPGVLIAADFNTGMAAYERQDYATAVKEFSALAEAGDSHAQYMLGRLYAQGNGVVQDFVQAHKWYNLAASRGHRHAAQARDALTERMPSAQIAEAQRLARQWQPEADAARVETPPAAPPLPARETITAIQRSLNELGYDAGPTDGLMGGKTRTAIRDYQADHGLPVDGQPSETLLEHLTETLRTARIELETPEPPDTDWPWRRLLLHDAFRDGDYTQDPAWTVAAGQFRVESDLGLRSLHEPRRAPAETRPEDLPRALIGAILEEAIRPRDRETSPGPPDYAEIYVDRTITNAFAIQLELTLRQAQGPLAFGPYQGRDRASGYRLVYTPNVARGLQLVRLAESGASVIESVDRRLSLNRQYAVQWTRDRRGEMAVALDGDEVFRVTDRGLTDPFDGFTLVNQGGDYVLREITIHGVD